MDTARIEDAAVSRHGWAALLDLLRSKGVITEEERQTVIRRAYRGAAEVIGRPVTFPQDGRP